MFLLRFILIVEGIPVVANRKTDNKRNKHKQTNKKLTNLKS